MDLRIMMSNYSKLRYKSIAWACAERYKLNPDIFWLKDASLADPDSPQPPDGTTSGGVGAARFRSVAARLGGQN
jgi:hypothetical protein